MMEQDLATVTLRDFLTVLFKHKWKIVTVLLTSVISVAVVTLNAPMIYQASSSLLVKFGRENIYRSEVGEKGAWVSLGREEMVNSEVQILTSRDLIEKAVRAMDPEFLYPERANRMRKNGASEESMVAAAVAEFKNSLSVQGVKRSNVIVVSFQHENPEVASRAVNLLVDLFKEKHLQVHSDPQSSFLEQQLRAYESGLEESEETLETYRLQYQTFSLPEQKTLLLQQRADFDKELKNTRNQVIELQEGLAALKTQMQDVPEDIPLAMVTDRHEIVDKIKNTLLNLQLKEQDLLIKYKENHPMVVNVRREIALAKDYLKRQEEDLKKVQTTGKNVVYQELEKERIKTQSELAAQQSKVTALLAQIRRLDGEIEALALKEKDLQRLLRDREINEKNYKTYLEKVEEARILEDMNLRKMANVSVIQKASTPLSPLKPRKSLYLAFSLIFGTVGGLGLAFLSEHAAQGFTTPEQVQKRLGLQVLVALPYRSPSLGFEDKISLRHRRSGV